MKKLILPLLLLTLTGCINFERADYAPSKKVDISSIENAKPKKLPKSRYGNPATYVVYGKRYHVLPNAKNYDKTGIASWYGMKFAGKLTSSHEVYNPYAMTAASKELPLPTFVKVTNLDNGKWIIVKVNDRGPFVSNRIIDLSYAAAHKLDIVKHGTGLVRIQAIDHADKINSTPMPSYAHNLYFQIGAYADKKNAESVVKKLTPTIKSPCQVYTNTLNGRTLYHVKVGPIKNLDASGKIMAQLAANGFKHPIQQQT